LTANTRRTAGTDAARQREVIDTLLAFVSVLRTLQLAERNHPWLTLPVTMAQLKALLLILQSGGLPSRGLADRLGIGPSAVTPLVDRLARQKLVRRDADANDRRIVWVRPTTRAIALQDRVMETNRSVLAEILAGLPAGDFRRVHDSLQRLLQGAERALARKQKSRVKTPGSGTVASAFRRKEPRSAGDRDLPAKAGSHNY
jgi:DNA-binding MarR family transcriptional regulator